MNRPKKIKKKSYKKFWLLLAITIAIIAFWQYRLYTLEQKSEQTFYEEFGINIPNNYTIHGIDVSKYQGYIYWKGVKNMNINNISIDFAFIKATEGLTSVDAMFKRNWKLSKENNVTRGAYHFFIASKDGKAQAQHFLNKVNFDTADLLPVIDIEEDFGMNKQTIVKRVKQFANEIESKLKVKPIIYSYANFYNEYLKDDFINYPLWVAHYNNNDQPSIKNNWQFWQHSEEGSVNGITSKVDFNVFNGSKEEFKKYLIK